MLLSKVRNGKTSFFLLLSWVFANASKEGSKKEAHMMRGFGTFFGGW